MKKAGFGLALASSMLVMNVGGVAQAASLPWADDSDFEVRKDSACSGSGLGYRDDSNNGFDQAGLVSVNGTVIGSGASTVDVTSSGTDSIATYSETIGDLGVEISYRFTNDNISRTLVTITNNGVSALTDLPVNIQNDLGNDDFEIVHVSGGSWRSSGDWFVSSESRFPGYYSEVFNVPDGPGSPESMASVTNCAGSALNLTTNADEFLVFGYQMDIPADESRRILIFQGVSMSGVDEASIIAAAVAKATAFDPGSQSLGSGILSDLSAEDACTVVNWAFAGCSSEGGGGSGYDIDISIDNYIRESDLPDTL